MGYSASIHDVTIFLNKGWTTKGLVNSAGIIHEEKDIYLWTARLIRGNSAIMGLSIVPTISLDQIDTSILEFLAKKCAEINQLGIPILLRFGPDMNGKS